LLKTDHSEAEGDISVLFDAPSFWKVSWRRYRL